MALSDRDRAVLEFERSWWTQPGSKEMAIRTRLGLSPGPLPAAAGRTGRLRGGRRLRPAGDPSAAKAPRGAAPGPLRRRSGAGRASPMTQPGRSTGSSTGTQTGKAVLVIAVVVVVGWWVLLKGTPSSHVATHNVHHPCHHHHPSGHPSDHGRGGADPAIQHQAAGAQWGADREPGRNSGAPSSRPIRATTRCPPTTPPPRWRHR